MKYSQLSRYGAIAKALPFSPGKIFFVLDPAETYLPDFLESFPPDEDGVPRVYTSLSDAYDACRSGYNDVIVLDGNATHDVTAMITVSKSRVHFVGLDWLLGIHRPYGQSSKVSLGVTTAATDLAALKVTGVRTSFRGIKFMSSNTKAESLYTFIDAGEYTYVEDCEIYKSTDLDETGAAELVLNADSSVYKNCTIGSTADALSGDVVRACVLLTKEIGGAGKVSRDVRMENCSFWRKASHVNNRFIYTAASSDIERGLTLINPIFNTSVLSAAVPAQAISAGASLADGYIIAINPVGIKVTKISTTTGVIVCGAAPNNGTGIAVNAA